jgi:hypothetical protein
MEQSGADIENWDQDLACSWTDRRQWYYEVPPSTPGVSITSLCLSLPPTGSLTAPLLVSLLYISTTSFPLYIYSFTLKEEAACTSKIWERSIRLYCMTSHHYENLISLFYSFLIRPFIYLIQPQNSNLYPLGLK